jgi:hypothetical protein
MFAKYINTSNYNNILLSDDYEYCIKFLNILCKDKFKIINNINLNKNKGILDTKNGTFLDIIDFFIMSRAKNIYGTNWSTYSKVPSIIFNINHIIVKDPNNYGLLIYNKSLNIGDTIQSLAVKQYLPYINQYIDRDSLSEYSNEYINIVFAGWFLHENDCLKYENDKLITCVCEKNKSFILWPPSNRIKPLFFSFHLANNKILNNIEYLKKHEPIGCRDLHTEELLKKNNIEAYFSGCITLTYKPVYNIEKISNQVLIIDVPEKLIDDDIKNKYKCIYKNNTYNTNIFFKMSNQEKEDIAIKMIKLILSSELVITSRLHILTICLANNINVKFLGNKIYSDDIKKNINYSSNRYSGIVELIDNKQKLQEMQKLLEVQIIRKIYNTFYNF